MEEIYFMEWDSSDKEVWKIPFFFSLVSWYIMKWDHVNCFPSPCKYNPLKVRGVVPTTEAWVPGHANLKRQELIFNTMVLVMLNLNNMHYKMI